MEETTFIIFMTFLHKENERLLYTVVLCTKVYSTAFTPLLYRRIANHNGVYSYDKTPENCVILQSVAPPITDPPRSGQPPYSGHYPC